MLSKQQQKVATKTADMHLDAVAVIRRDTGPTETPTGRQAGLSVIYDQIPCTVAPTTTSHPTSQNDAQQGTETMDQSAYAWFPVEWQTGAENTWADPPVKTPVTVLFGDAITINGQVWYATTDEDPTTGFQVWRRVKIDRTHGKPAQ